MKKHEITMKALKESGVSACMRKDNSPRGCSCVSVADLHVGDEIVVDDYFTVIVEEIKQEGSK